MIPRVLQEGESNPVQQNPLPIYIVNSKRQDSIAYIKIILSWSKIIQRSISVELAYVGEGHKDIYQNLHSFS